METGVDNNLGVINHTADVTEGVALQCSIYREYQAMSLLAGNLSYTSDATRYLRKANALRERIRDGV